MNSHLIEKTAKYSIAPGGRQVEPEIVVVVPPRADPLRGFERARALLERGPVRLIAHGATLEHTWPDWVRTVNDLVLTELGAYIWRSPAEETRELRQQVKLWLEETFAGILDGLPAADALYGAAAVRFLQPVFDAAPLASGIAERHPHALIVVIDPAWAGIPALKAALERTGGRVEAELRSTSTQARWALDLGAKMGAALTGALLKQGRDFVRSLPMLKALRAAPIDPGRSPDLWVGVIGDWERANRHLISSLVLPELERGTKLGFLLVGGLKPGRRREANMRTNEGDALFTGLERVRSYLSLCPIDQVIQAHTARELFRTMRRTACEVVRVAIRLIRNGPRIDRGALQVDLSVHTWSLAKLATLDVSRALAAAAATRRAIDRWQLGGQTVVLAASTLAEAATADVVLRNNGVVTCDYYHGAGMEGWIGAQESRSQYRCLFTHADAETVRAVGQKAIVGGMPKKPLLPPRAARARRRLLLLTNYCHRDYEVDGRFPFECFQNELLRLVDLLAAEGIELDVRWRPHPADNEDAVRRALARMRTVERSPNQALDDDLAWSDLVISAMSTTVLESLFAGVPVFVHVPPEAADGPNARFLDPTRVFFYSREAAPRIAQLLRSGVTDLSPEHRARQRYFGGRGVPFSLGDVLRDTGLLRPSAGPPTSAQAHSNRGDGNHPSGAACGGAACSAAK